MTILVGDCRTVMAGMEPDSVDSVVCDPPYGISFMQSNNKGWDRPDNVAFEAGTWTAALRVAKPGAYLVAFGSPRQFHRLMIAIEDGGWILQDTLMHLHGQGFPKGKAQLKPAFEPIVLARKKGPAVLQIDACRIEGAPPSRAQPIFNSPTGQTYGFKTGKGRNGEMSHAAGRWPSNVILDETAARALDEAVGERPGSRPIKRPAGFERFNGQEYNNGKSYTTPAYESPGYGDSGGPSRFFVSIDDDPSDGEVAS